MCWVEGVSRSLITQPKFYFSQVSRVGLVGGRDPGQVDGPLTHRGVDVRDISTPGKNYTVDPEIAWIRVEG